jgi:hypothetical protein
MASGKKGGIGSFFKKVTTTPSVATLSQLQSGLESAAAISIAIVTERWPESSSLLQSCDADCCSDEKALCVDP